YKTTTGNLQARLNELVPEKLPQNLEGAIVVTQSIGDDYIWIDSICILQDSPQDLEAEMKVMLEVYANAYFVLSATSA
ncbi:HET-domain-containing protein, partial [Acephala macrosclerotiorum]